MQISTPQFTEQETAILKMALDTLLATHQQRLQLAVSVGIIASKIEQAMVTIPDQFAQFPPAPEQNDPVTANVIQPAPPEAA